MLALADASPLAAAPAPERSRAETSRAICAHSARAFSGSKSWRGGSRSRKVECALRGEVGAAHRGARRPRARILGGAAIALRRRRRLPGSRPAGQG